MQVKFQGSFTNGIYFSTKVSNILSRVNGQSGCMERRQSVVTNWSGLWLLRHTLLAASNCGVVAVCPHLESATSSSSLVSPLSAAVHLVVAAVSSEIADAAAETALTAVVNSATVAELLPVMLAFFIS